MPIWQTSSFVVFLGILFFILGIYSYRKMYNKLIKIDPSMQNLLSSNIYGEIILAAVLMVLYFSVNHTHMLKLLSFTNM